MKKMRKLIPAFAMLLVSAIMMSTASFAWFSMNQQVTAAGMQVKAQATGGLAIAPWATNDAAPGPAAYTKDATMGWSNKNTNSTLFPASFDNVTWVTGEAANPNSHTASGYSLVPSGGQGYYLASKWSFKSLAEDGSIDVSLTGIEVTVTGENATTAELKHALRVVIYNVEENAYYHFAPCYTTVPTGGLSYTKYTAAVEGVSAASYTPTAHATAGVPITVGATPDVVIANDVTQTPDNIEVYIYFEGEDEYCTSAYAVNAQNISVKLTFTQDT